MHMCPHRFRTLGFRNSGRSQARTIPFLPQTYTTRGTRRTSSESTTLRRGRIALEAQFTGKLQDVLFAARTTRVLSRTKYTSKYAVYTCPPRAPEE